MTDSRCNLRHPSSSSLSNTSTINVQHIATAEGEIAKKDEEEKRTKMRRKKEGSVYLYK